MGFWNGTKWGCGTLFGLWVAGGLITCTSKSCGGTGNAKTDLYDAPKDALTKLVDSRDFEDVKTPTGSFDIDFVTQKGVNKRYVFDVLGRDSSGEIKVKVKELGSDKSVLGGTARFNVVFWNQVYPDKKGVGFNVCLNNQGGLSIGPYNSRFQTLIISDGERTCGQCYSNNRVGFSQISPDLRRSKVMKRVELTLPEKLMTIPKSVIDCHDTYGNPVMLPAKASSVRAATENSR